MRHNQPRRRGGWRCGKAALRSSRSHTRSGRRRPGHGWRRCAGRGVSEQASILPLEEAVGRAGDQRDSPAQAARGGKPPAEATGGGSFARQALDVRKSAVRKCVGPPKDSPRHYAPIVTPGRAEKKLLMAIAPQLAGASLSCVLVSKSLASCRSCNWVEGSP